MIKNLKNLFSKLDFLFLFLLIILLDQLSKYWAQSMNWVIINPGLSFSLFQAEVGVIILLLFLVFTFFLLKWFFRNSFLITIFIAAAFSNILDRIVFHGVRDWLSIPILNLKNNLADWLMFLVMVFYLAKNIKYANRNNF